MATVGTIVIGVTAKSDAFTRTINKSKKELGGFVKQAEESKAAMSALTSGLIGVGAAVGVAKLGGLVKEQLDFVDTTSDVAQRLGITCGELQNLRWAAKLSGSSVEGLDASLDQMTKRLGSGALGKPLANLGLSEAMLDGKNAAQQFTTIAEAISKIESPSQRAAAAVAIFGKQGQQMLGTLALGKAGLAEMGAEAEQAGYSFSDALAADVQKANDAIDKLGMTIQGAEIQLAGKLAPTIEVVTNNFTQWAIANDNLANKSLGFAKWITFETAKLREFADLVIYLKDLTVGFVEWISGLSIKITKAQLAPLQAMAVAIDALSGPLAKFLGLDVGPTHLSDKLNCILDQVEAIGDAMQDIGGEHVGQAIDKWVEGSSPYNDTEKLWAKMDADLAASKANQVDQAAKQASHSRLNKMFAPAKGLLDMFVVEPAKLKADNKAKEDKKYEGNQLGGWLHTIKPAVDSFSKWYTASAKDAKEWLKKQDDITKNLKESLESPLEKFGDRLKLLSEQRTAIGEEKYQRGVKQAREEYLSDIRPQEVKRTDAMELSKHMAISSYQGVQQKPELEIAKKQLDEQVAAKTLSEQQYQVMLGILQALGG